MDKRRQHDRRRTRPPGVARPPRSKAPTAAHVASGHGELLRLQTGAGNMAVARALDVQRQPTAGVIPGQAPAPPLARLKDTTLHSHSGPRFDLSYTPVAPLPHVGTATVTLKINVTFKDFDRAMMRRPEFRRHRWTAAQRSKFTWPADKKREWVAKFSSAVSDGWKEKHAFVLDQPGFEKYRAKCDIVVKHVDDPLKANTAITAQWVPPGAPRLRSSVSGGGSTGELDARDVDEPETRTVTKARLVRQIGPFDLNSPELTPTVLDGINKFEAAVKRQAEPGRLLAGPISDISATFTGRASPSGSITHNQKLAAARADAVSTRVITDLDLGFTISSGVGERNALDDPSFQRVDAAASKGSPVEVSQNVAAHEAGHMFGLGDEYVEEKPPKDVTAKFEGDKARHDADVRGAMGDEAADELLVQGGSSMMSGGNEVKAGHYVYFLTALNSVTGQTWKVE